MSKSVTLKSKGVSHDYDGIQRVQNETGWIPEDETEGISVTITENGEYSPADDGAFCYSEVTVNVESGGPVIYFGTEPSAMVFEGMGMDISYGTIYAKYPDGTIVDITEQCTIHPDMGSYPPTDSDEVEITITWNGEQANV